MTTSTIRLDVSVFPPTTAARRLRVHEAALGRDARSTGTNAPPDAGMSGSHTARTQK